jgi:dTDP-4-amino-4,6-dideoxy-D-galactose acyltransferase
MHIEQASWDTKFYGYQVGKITIEDQFTESDLALLREKSKAYKVVYVFSSSPVSLLEPFIKDVKVMFEKHLSEPLIPESDLVEFNSAIHSYDQLEAIALKTGVFSRFKLDKNFNQGEYEKLYSEWIKKSVQKIIADHIFIKLIENRIVGFISMRYTGQNMAEIELVAVADEYRGKGLARKFINHCDAFTLQSGRSTITVPTQEFNEPAMNLYLKTGFNIKNKTYTYHIWNL